METAPERPAESARWPERRRDPTIERNGGEYLVTINGSVFVALSLAEAESVAYRLGRRLRDAG